MVGLFFFSSFTNLKNKFCELFSGTPIWMHTPSYFLSNVPGYQLGKDGKAKLNISDFFLCKSTPQVFDHKLTWNAWIASQETLWMQDCMTFKIRLNFLWYAITISQVLVRWKISLLLSYSILSLKAQRSVSASVPGKKEMFFPFL